MSTDFTPELIRAMALAAGFEVPPEDLEALRAAVSSRLASCTQLASLEISDTPPITRFDPRW
jgi:hypothetical protein